MPGQHADPSDDDNPTHLATPPLRQPLRGAYRPVPDPRGEPVQSWRDATMPVGGSPVGYRIGGGRDGLTVVWMHGLGGSRLELHPDPTIPAAVGVRVLSFDRPGIGLSAARRGHRVLDVAGTMLRVIDELGLDRFSVAGVAWGAPYAAALAVLAPDRVHRLGLVSPIGGWLTGFGALRILDPQWRRLRRAVQLPPPALRLTLTAATRTFQHDPHGTLNEWAERAGPADRQVLTDLGLRSTLIAKTGEGLRAGIDGQVDDTLAVARPWRFRLSDVHTPSVLWWGEQDTEISEQSVRDIAEQLPGADLRTVPDAGHLLYLSRWRSILNSLAE